MGTDGRERALAAQQAAEWLGRLPTASRREQKEFITWLKASPSHARAMLQALHGEDLLRDLHRTRPIDVEALIRKAQEAVPGHVYPGVVAMMERPDDLQGQHAGRQASIQRAMGRRTWAVIAASVAVVTALTLLLVRSTPDKVIATEASEWRRVELSDGTTVRVGPHTRLEVFLGDRQRLIRMSDGEALFEVAKDSSRPFLVESGLATVRAVGTRFGVSHLSKRDGIVVTVSEGTVAVSSPSSARQEISLSAGEEIFVNRSESQSARRVDAAVELAWAEGALVFDDETVQEAADQFNRRNRLQLHIDDPHLASMPIRGRLPANDPLAFAAVLMRTDRASAVRKRGQVIEIIAVDSPPSQ